MTAKHRILYVEDHEDTSELVTMVLQDRDYEVLTAQTIEAAMSMVHETRFDLYLLDSWLPDGSGIELCRRIRRVDTNTPILFYSAAAYEGDQVSAITAGAQGYLIKPASFSDLCKLINALINAAPSDGKRMLEPDGLPYLRLSPEVDG
ncbi:MAG: response regulator transcription factor [Pyrinomonadaceae bacterium]